MGKGTNTTTNTTAPNPAAMSAYSSLMDRASGVASTPYAAYTGELTAPINAQQNLGIGNINANAGFASPYIQQAAGYATDAARPITADDIARYQNPYTQQVVDATQAQFTRTNAQQQEGLKGRAIAQGALGGSRAKIAAADMAYQQQQGQAPVIAGLYDKSYGTALSTAQQQQQNLGNAAYSIGNLGVAGQNAALTGAGAQVGAGSLEQQNEQQRLAALYQQYQIAQAFPYQQTQWLAGIDTGVGSQMGGTSTTKGPAPNPWSQIAGAGLAGLGVAGGLGWKPFAASARGGGILGFDAGGSVGGDMPYAGVGWIPQRPITMGRGAPPAPGMPAAPTGGIDTRGIAALMGDRRTPGVGAPIDLNAYGAKGAVVGDIMPPAPQSGFDEPIYRHGGGVHGFAVGGSPMSFDDRWGLTTGGVDDVPSSPVGGFVPMPRARPDVPISFADRWAPASDAVDSGTFDPVGTNNTSAYAFAPEGGLVPTPRARPDEAPQGDVSREASWQPAPREGDPVLDTPGLARSYAEERPAGVGAAPASAEPQGPGGLANLSMPLMAAGFGMMASRAGGKGSFLQAAGEGGMSGLNVYAQQKQQAIQAGERAKRFELDARRLDQAAEQSRKQLELRTEGLVEQRRHHGALENRDNIKPTGTLTEDGHPIGYDTRRPGIGIDLITGQPLKADQKVTSAKAGALSDSAIDVGARQMAKGDLSPLKNVGRGAQGAADVARLRNKAADILVTEQGMSPEAAADYMSGQVQAFNARGIGLSAEARTGGTREANLKIILKATEAAIPAALEASENVARTGWVPLNRIIQKGQVIASTPELREFGMANLQLAEHWARAMNPTGVMRESDREKALEFLSTADSKDTYKRVVAQLKKQIDRELAAVQSSGTNHATPKAGETPPAGGPAGTVPDTVRQNGHTYKRQPDGSMKAID